MPIVMAQKIDGVGKEYFKQSPSRKILNRPHEFLILLMLENHFCKRPSLGDLFRLKNVILMLYITETLFISSLQTSCSAFFHAVWDFFSSKISTPIVDSPFVVAKEP